MVAPRSLRARSMRGRAPSVRPGRWLVALPVWGDRCVRVFMRSTLPALLVALEELRRPVSLLIWTDQAERLSEVLRHSPGDFSVIFSDPPGPDAAFESMSNCHRQALGMADVGERVLLLTSDMVVSREVLATCEQQIMRGKQLVCCVPPRTLEDAVCPLGVPGRALLEWAWENRHPMTRECTWPGGRSYDVWRMYFEKGGEVAARVFLPHPLVVVPNGRSMSFRPTIDVNLTSNFSRAVTYLITSPKEGAVVELSPAEKDFLLTTTMRERLGAGGPSCPSLIACTNGHHRMFYSQRVVLRGTGGDCGDEEVVRRILG